MLTLYEAKREFSANLRYLMNEKEMGQRELSKRSGISRSTIQDYLNQKTLPGYQAIVNLAYALECDLDDLIDCVGEKIEN